jgi:hypothetical protein
MPICSMTQSALKETTQKTLAWSLEVPLEGRRCLTGFGDPLQFLGEDAEFSTLKGDESYALPNKFERKATLKIMRIQTTGRRMHSGGTSWPP